MNISESANVSYSITGIFILTDKKTSGCLQICDDRDEL